MFEKLLKASDILCPSVTKLLHKAGLPVGNVLHFIKDNKFDFSDFLEEKELLRLTNPDNIRVESNYRGPRMLLYRINKLDNFVLF
jgi:hypothetical protein